jgi:hypothetical protein
MPEKDLGKLLSSMQPRLQPGSFVFCTVSENRYRNMQVEPLCYFREDEGISLILSKENADKLALQYSSSWSLITCEVNSDLNAVGFIAAISHQLAIAGIPTNPVSAYFHDHLFVPNELAQQATNLLVKLSKENATV